MGRHPWHLGIHLAVLALAPATSFTRLLVGTILGTLRGPIIRRGRVQTELFLETTLSFSVCLLQGWAALSTSTFAFGTFRPTKFGSVPVFATLCAMSFLAFALCLTALSLPILFTSSTATLVLVAAVLTTYLRAPFTKALALVLPASTALHSCDLGCIFMLGPIAVFAPPNLIHQELMDSFHRHFLSMYPFQLIHLIQVLTVFTVLHQRIHKNFLCSISCNRHGVLKQKTPFQQSCSIFLQRLSRRRLGCPYLPQ